MSQDPDNNNNMFSLDVPCSKELYADRCFETFLNGTNEEDLKVEAYLASMMANSSVNGTDPSCVYMSILTADLYDITQTTWFISLAIVFYGTMIVAAVVMNAVVLLAILRYRHFRSLHCALIAVLSVTDIMLILTSGIITPINIIRKTWIFGEYLCKIIPFFQGVGFFACAYVLTAISVDCYLQVCHPHVQRNIEGATRLLILAIAAVVAVVMAGIPVSIQQYESIILFCDMFCREKWGSRAALLSYSLSAAMLQYVLPLCLITFCTVATRARISKVIGFRIARTRNRSTVAMNPQQQRLMPGSRPASTDTQQLDGPTAQTAMPSAELTRLSHRNRVLLLMCCTFALHWGPQLALNFIRDWKFKLFEFVNQMPLVTLIAHAIAMLSTVTNPILYGLCNLNVRIGVMTMLRLRSSSLPNPGRIPTRALLSKQNNFSNNRLFVPQKAGGSTSMLAASPGQHNSNAGSGGVHKVVVRKHSSEPAVQNVLKNGPNNNSNNNNAARRVSRTETAL